MNTYAFTYQKTYKIKKQVLVALVIFAAVITGLLIGNNLLQEHQAQASSAYEEIVYYKSIEVKDGDTLWTIADTYMGNEFQNREDYIKEVKRLNHLSDDTIQSGAFLMIPYTEQFLK